MTTASSTKARHRVRILGVPVDRVSMEESLARIEAMMKEDRPHVVVTVDSSGIVQAQRDLVYRRIVEEASLVTPDSEGVVWAAKRQGKPVGGRVSGVELLDRLCGFSADKGYRIFLLGAAPGVAEQAAERLRLRHPGCNIVGARHGYFPPDSDEIVAREIAAAKPDMIFVAMGIPRQEKFIHAAKAIVGARLAMGVGGSLDVFAGKAKRAPLWVQRVRLEWLWRVANPKRWHKAKHLPVFAWRVLVSPK
ncbi:MAG: WecB/TagA/CpsF family glycosyltransferase [Fimbriimonas ginsengisoli]|uniref:WecB/TagA/CpsF family glycosyltransferase n=1 Tax=Fimbriimonas ginsengisoli TaxID=1005039 RepID=A0A931M0D3_FIMGI|nr:WecB/TagA/CpsF family glycosyltransferase [Fimbriimonas ginsengisoli]MBI3721175.1 WecB/TagA/CpsF family glycosyltransferase [Fimbriimonas ginsengisoli]